MSLRSLVSALCAFVVVVALTGCGSSSYGPSKGRQMGLYGGEKTRPDPLLERRILLAHPSSGEKLDLVYYHNGTYDPAALAAINRLMRDRSANEIGVIDPELIDFLVDIRTRLGLPPTVVFDILSGYRSRSTNTKLAQTNKNVAKESLHMYGYAVDFHVAGVKGSAIAEIAKTMQRGGVSFYPRTNHVHVDIGNIRTWNTPK